jgi:hypothetical protein
MRATAFDWQDVRDMTRFWLRIHGDDLGRAMVLLNGVNIPTIGIFSAYHGNQLPPDLQLHGLTAAVDAESEGEAKSRVLSVLPDGYEVEHRDIGPA